MISRLYVFRCQEEEFQDIAIDAVFGKDDDEVLRDGDSDSDGYLDEVFNLVFGENMNTNFVLAIFCCFRFC
jgi:hypothetical protein